MSVETALGISSEMAAGIVSRRWPQWVRQCPALATVNTTNLRRWLRTVGSHRAGIPMYQLARLASQSGGDDLDAARLLAWAMLPTAAKAAIELRDLDPDIDSLVVSQLWIEIRTFDWRASTKFLGNLASSIRRALLREYRLEPRQPAKGEATIDPDEIQWFSPEWVTPDDDARDVLLAVLDWGVDSGTIAAEDRELLLDLVDESSRDPKHHSPRRALLGSSDPVGAKWGITSRTVRRRGRRALDALAARAAEFAELVEPLAS